MIPAQRCVSHPQAVAGAPDPEAALAQAGAAFDPGMAVVYLSPEQLRLVREELERMSAAMDTISIEVDCHITPPPVLGWNARLH